MKNQWRTILLVAGIALSVSIMISANVVMDSASAAIKSYFEDDSYHDLEIRELSSETFSFTPELENLLSNYQIAGINLVLERILPLEEIYAGNSTSSIFRVVGFSGVGPEVEEIHERHWTSPSKASPYSLEDYILNYDECIIDADIMGGIAGLGLRTPLPETILLNLTSRPEIAHIIHGAQHQLWEAFFNIELLWDSWNPENRPISALRIRLKDWTEIFEVKEELEEQLGSNFLVKVLKKVGEEKLAGIRSYEDALQTIVLIAAAVEFLFVLSQMIGIIFSERRVEIGQLRVLGTTRLGIFEMILMESVIYGAIGSCIGAYVGLTGAVLLTNLLGTYPYSTRVVTIVDLGTIAIGLLYGTLITLLAALLPSVYVAHQPPQQALQSYSRSAGHLGRKPFFLFVGIALLLFLFGFSLLAQVKATGLIDMTLFVDNTLPIGIILVSAIFFEIALIRLLIPIFEKTWWPFPAFVRSISSRHILRSFRRNCAAIVTAAVGIAFVVTAAIFTASLQKTLPGFLEGSSIGEIILDSGEGGEQPINISENITALMPEVQEITYALGGQFFIDGKRINAVGIHEDLVYSPISLKPPKIVAGPTNAFQLVAATSSSSAPYCILSTSLATKLGAGRGDTIYATQIINGSLCALQIIALVEPTIFLNSGENMFVDYNWLASHIGLSGQARWFFVASSSPRETYRMLVLNFPDTFYRIIPVFKQQTRITETVEKQTVFFQALLALLMGACLLTQGTAYLMAAIEREREVGIIRASGAEQSQVSQIFVVESMMMMFTSLLVGLIDAALLSALLLHIASTAPIQVQISIPWIQILFWLCLAVTVNYIAARMAFNRVRTQTPAQSLRIPNQ